MIPDPAPPFEVDASGIMKDRMRRMFARATELGVQAEIARALTSVLQHLVTEPREWGDPLWHLRAAQMTQYGGISEGMRCQYTVHDRIPTVVITNLFPIAGNPLYGENFDG